MNICLFGSFDPLYARNKILIDGLKKNGGEVYLCRSDNGFFITRYIMLVKNFCLVRNKIDVIYVAFVGHLNVPLAWVLGKLFGKKVVFDMFYSMYDTYVFDRRSTSAGSLKALIYWLIDKIAVTLPDIVIADTIAHANYWKKILKIKKNKFHRLFVGGDDTVFKPFKHKTNKKLTVEFHGIFTRLHGAEYFVEAAKKLEHNSKVKFLLIGETTNYDLPLRKLNQLQQDTVKYSPKIPAKKLAETIAKCDIAVGHLGTTIKARSVITNKIFQALACGLPVIVGDCPASRELLTDKENCILVKMGDTDDLVEKIKWLENHPHERDQIAENGYRLFQTKLTNKALGKELIEILRAL